MSVVARNARANALRLVQEEVAIAQGGFRILVDCDLERLDMTVGPAFPGGRAPGEIERFQEFGRVLHVGEILRSSLTISVLPRPAAWYPAAPPFSARPVANRGHRPSLASGLAELPPRPSLPRQAGSWRISLRCRPICARMRSISERRDTLQMRTEWLQQWLRKVLCRI